MKTKDVVYPLLAALCYGTNPILAKLGLHLSNEPLLGACIGIVASTIVYTAYFFLSGQGHDLVALPRQAGWYFGLAGMVSTLAIFSLFFALERLPASIVAPFISTVPLVTLILSYLILHDVGRVTRADVIGTILIVAGVVVVVS